MIGCAFHFSRLAIVSFSALRNPIFTLSGSKKKKFFVRPVSVTLSESMFRQIYEIAEKEEVSMSEIIREAIQEKLESNSNKVNNN